MSEKNTPFHGSDLEKIEKIYKIKKEEIISFSSNVNPLGISDKLKKELSLKLDCLSNYPDREYVELRQAMGNYCQINPDNIFLGNGTSDLISKFIRLINPSKALILGPTYSEYEREVKLCNGEAKYFELKESDDFKLDFDAFAKELSNCYDLLVICNPNNPTSSAIDNITIKKILDLCKEYNTFLIIDETYVEFCSQVDKISSVKLTQDYDNLLVLRGVSKFFAAPGLRLGYGINSSDSLKAQIENKKEPWNINTLAEEAGKLMFSDNEYIEKTKNLISQERKRLYEIFSKSSLYKPYRAEANFILLKILDDNIKSGYIFEKAIKEKMMIRDCQTFPFLNDSYIRFCILNKNDNDKLVECLLSVR
ncbi:threonine-phosphate decarboxylase [Acetitomaculum ruminis DSM 5522]|uniref:Aminotransferase n=1 Tax=Acetitomaculum ruminis DSM 5522 TaxID=1120918 RepID=A0A1I0XUK7_9FIRM|nr:histidinol-phosphate transaminase [Acetitomaculum ruminis]SFB04106.1 threonine-phosphate decarboxylase [Acetitomaculum ruminis DSM 5522]